MNPGVNLIKWIIRLYNIYNIRYMADALDASGDVPPPRRRFHTRQTTFRQLEIFLEVARRGSVTEAARALHLAQPTVSTQLGRLQETLGELLFDQVGRRLDLTDSGAILQRGCEELFEVLDRIDSRLGALHGLTAGTLRLGVVTTAKYLMPAYLGAFCRRFPDVEVQFSICNRNELVSRLEANQDDFYVFSLPPVELDICAHPFADNPLVFIAPVGHPLAGRSGLTWDDLAQWPLLMREAGSGTRLAIERAFRANGWPFAPRMVIASNEAIKESVLAGLGIAVLSRHTLHHVGGEDLVELDVAGFPVRTAWSVVHWRRKVFSPAAEAFLAHLGINVEADGSG